MNLILTDKCTNSCPYCFASQEMSRTVHKNDMSREDFNSFMDFIRGAGKGVNLNVIGGEPLIYHDLDYVLGELFKCNSVSAIFLLTGGVVRKESFDSLLAFSDKLSIMFNVNERESYLFPKHYYQVLENLEYTISLGLRIGVGFNIYHHEFAGNEIIALCVKFGITHLRFSVACPIYGSENSSVVPTTEYHRLSSRVFEFLLACSKVGIEANLDCPLPFCFFTDEQLGILSKIHPGVISRLGRCTPPIDINYNLQVLRCFSVGGGSEQKYLRDFTSIEEIKDWFISTIDSRLIQPSLFTECKACPHSKICNGGCLSNNRGFMSLPPKIRRMEKALDMASMGRLDEAREIILKERVLDAVDCFILAKLYYNSNLMNEAEYYGRRALHLSSSSAFRNDVASFLADINQTAPLL